MGFHISKCSQDNKTKKTTWNLASKQSQNKSIHNSFLFLLAQIFQNKKINCPINPSFISSHLISPSLSNPTVFYSPCYTPLGVPGFHPWEVFPTPPFSLPGFRNLEFQDVHLSYRPSKRGRGHRDEGREVVDGSLPAGPMARARGIFLSDSLLMEGFWGWKNLSPTTDSDFFLKPP